MSAKSIVERLISWWRFSLLRAYEWQSSPRYWQLKRAWKANLFFIRKSGFKTKSHFRGSFEIATIFWQVLKTILWRLIVAVLLVVALAVIERHIQSWKLHWLNFPMEKDAQRDFFATLGQISASFLPLYFTAISVVVSTAYARVPGNIRSLIMREQVGSMYFGILAQFVAVVTVMLTALSFGYPIGPLNTWLASFLCLFATFAFVVLGARAFAYFSPTALVSLLNRDLMRSIESVTPAGYQWADESFQAHHQRHAQELLNSYSDLVTVASHKENLHGKGLVEIGQGLLLVLNIYAKEKSRIPSSSHWFRRKYKHKDWLLASHNELEIAVATGTVIQPETVPDLMWFETDAARILAEIFYQLGERRDSAGVVTLATNLQNHMGGMGQCLAVAEALHVFKAVAPILRSQFSGDQIVLDRDTSKGTDRLAVAELYSLALINVLLGSSDQLGKLDAKALGGILASVNWMKVASLYPGNILPRSVIQEMEFLQDRLDFEFRIEGRIFSPPWLRNEMAALGYVRFLDEMSKALLQEVELALGKEVESQLAAKSFVLVGQLVQRGLEACEKLSKHFIKLKGLHDECSALNRSKEYEWPKIDWDALEARIAALREQFVKALARSSDELAKLPELKSWPDFFGHAYTVLSEECFTAMEAGKEELFRILFPAFFNLVLRANEKLRQKFLGDNRNIRLSVDPLVDLMAMSGFAAVFAELDNKDFWKLAEQCWNNYFGLFKDEQRRRQIIELLCAVVEPDWRITPRSVMRTRWQQMFGRVLRARGIFRARAFWDDRRTAVNHPSLLVRVFCRSEDLFTEAHDVFLTVYVFKRPESAGVQKPHDVESLERDLQPEADDENEFLAQ